MQHPIQLISAIAPVRNPLTASPWRRGFLLLLLGLSCTLLPRAGAVPLTISFYQSGFTGGGYISGSLFGEDLNDDQIIDASEFAHFRSLNVVFFSGNSLLPAFTWRGFYAGPDLNLLTMRLGMWTEQGGGPPGFYGVWEYYSYYPPGYPIQGVIDLDLGDPGIIELRTARAPVVWVTDAGSTGAMLALALGGLMMAGRRHSKKSLITCRLSR